MAVSLGLRERVEFVGKKRHEEMRPLLARAGQVLVVPSLWEEPFSLVVMEGMSVGLVVVASDTGGTGEGIQHGHNGFLFPRNDAPALGAIIDRLEDDRQLCQRAGDHARACVRLTALHDRTIGGSTGGTPGVLPHGDAANCRLILVRKPHAETTPCTFSHIQFGNSFGHPFRVPRPTCPFPGQDRRRCCYRARPSGRRKARVAAATSRSTWPPLTGATARNYLEGLLTPDEIKGFARVLLPGKTL